MSLLKKKCSPFRTPKSKSTGLQSENTNAGQMEWGNLMPHRQTPKIEAPRVGGSSGLMVKLNYVFHGSKVQIPYLAKWMDISRIP